MVELLLWVLTLILGKAPEPAPRAVDFQRDVRPILEKRCQPCHFEGGKMYAKLPFDRPQTIDKLGTRLFSRIKKEEERTVITAFLDRHLTGQDRVESTRPAYGPQP